MKLASPVNHEAPDTESKEVEALMKLVLPVKELTPEKVLLLESKVVEATEMEAPALKETPLMVLRYR